MKVTYLAHPLGSGPQRARNRRNASRWVAWIAKNFEVAPVADWVLLSEHWDEETGRERGLRIDCKLIERCDQLWMVGGRISPGMEVERAHAIKHGIRVVDLTWIGWRAPRGVFVNTIARVRELSGADQ